MNNVNPPSPIPEDDTPDYTSNGPGIDDSFTTAKEESFDLSSLELGKLSEQMEQILAQLDYTDPQTVINAIAIQAGFFLRLRPWCNSARPWCNFNTAAAAADPNRGVTQHCSGRGRTESWCNSKKS